MILFCKNLYNDWPICIEYTQNEKKKKKQLNGSINRKFNAQNIYKLTML